MKKCSGKSNIEIVKSYLNNERPFVQVGYEPLPEEKHKDGDIWTDKNGIEWIQVGASRISKKLYDTRESTRQICSICNRDVSWSSNQNDVKFFNKTGKCYDCVIEEEHKMRLDGTFETYEKIKVINNQRSYLKDLKEKIEESINWLHVKSNKIEYLNEDGSTDTWTDLSRETFLSEAKNDLAEVNKSLILCDMSIEMLETKLNELKSKQSTVS
jgi:hypothetical protein